MEQETKTIKTPVHGHDIEIKTWITAGARRDIMQALLDNAEINVADVKTAKTNVGKINPKILSEMQDATIKALVVSIGGNKDNILKTVLGFHKDDFDFLIEELNKISGGLPEEKKTV